MPDFKFSCPQCGQNIACDTSYAGAQVNCPSCNQGIVVPQAPGAYAAPPAVPPPGPGSRIPAGGQRFSAAQAPVQEKPTVLRNVLVIAAVVVLLAALGAGGWVGYSKYRAKQVLKKENPAAVVATPTAAQTANGKNLWSQVQNAYTNLASLEMSGTSVMALDLSQVTAADLSPNPNKNSKKQLRPNIPKAVTYSLDVSLKLGRPGRYCLQGTGMTKVGQTSVSNTMAMWSLGETNYSLMIAGGGAYKNYTAARNRETALRSSGQPNVLAMIIMNLFFNDANTNMDKFVHDWGQTEDDSVNGQDCSTVTAKVYGQKLKLWISKDKYMVLQSQMTMGAPISDADLDSAADMFDTSTNEEQITIDKAQARQQVQMMSKIRGTITETYDEVEANPTLMSDDFNYPVPRGIRMSRPRF